jgi:DNA helicase-2/ATP-dependent DNA helicase PcrA
MLDNPDDDTAFERVINTPARGIGAQTLTLLREQAQQQKTSLWQATQYLLQAKQLTPRAQEALYKFTQLFTQIKTDCALAPLGDLTEQMIKRSGLLDFYHQEKSEKALARLENLEELVNATRQFMPDEADKNITPLQAFLAHAALEAGDNQSDTHTDCVQLMTLHAAKGLEFPLVFMCGMEEGLFPHAMSKELAGLEEERRLCYVGMTRAMRKLYLTYAESRRLHGSEVFHRPSRFLQEIPQELLQPVRLTTKVTLPFAAQATFSRSNTAAGDTGFALGQRVRHEKFGEGTVLNYEGSGAHARIQVKFNKTGVKWLVLSYANLKIL